MRAEIQPPAPASTRSGHRLDAEQSWVRWAVAAAVTGMVAWIVGTALLPVDAKLDRGEAHLALLLHGHMGQLYAAGLLAIVGAVLLVGFFAALTVLVPHDRPGGGLLQVSLAGCVVTQTMVAVGASFGLAAVHAAAGHASAGLVVLAWRGLWLIFIASALPTILFTVTAVLGLGQAHLSPTWVSVLGWVSAAAHVLGLTALAQSGAFAPDGVVPTFVPVTTVLWILALAATLPRSWKAAVEARYEPASAPGFQPGQQPAPEAGRG